MDESDFEGTLVLEQLAAIGKVEEFFDAIEDDVARAASSMRKTKIDAATIALVVRKMEDDDGEHRAERRRVCLAYIVRDRRTASRCGLTVQRAWCDALARLP